MAGENIRKLASLFPNAITETLSMANNPTDNDFIYNDDFRIPAGEYVPNPASNGRFHTDWLNMISPRLKVARDFLSPGGVILISIDDNEVANLPKVCDEIFGS